MTSREPTDLMSIPSLPPLFTESSLVGLLDESNASALDAALDAVLIFVDKGPWTPSLTEAIVPVLISKALPARPGTVKKANAVLLKTMEVHPHTAQLTIPDTPTHS